MNKHKHLPKHIPRLIYVYRMSDGTFVTMSEGFETYQEACDHVKRMAEACDVAYKIVLTNYRSDLD